MKLCTHPDTKTLLVHTTNGISIRKRKRGRGKSHFYPLQDFDHLGAEVIHHTTTQYSLKEDYRQTKVEQKENALESLMLTKEKIDGIIKGRACADG